jgi:hypothetical protein
MPTESAASTVSPIALEINVPRALWKTVHEQRQDGGGPTLLLHVPVPFHSATVTDFSRGPEDHFANFKI